MAGSENDSQSHGHELLDNSGVGRVQIAGDKTGQFDVGESVLFDQIVPLMDAAIDGQPELC